MLCTTLNKIRDHKPCKDGWQKLLKHLGKTSADDEPLPFAVIVESNGLDDALWAMRTAPQYGREWRLFAVWCARQVQHLMTDQRSLSALDVAERFANGEATHKELLAACDAAWAATTAASVAVLWAASKAAALAASVTDPCAAAWEASDAASVAASRAASVAASDAASVAASRAASVAAAWAAACDAQRIKFLEIVA